MKKIMKLQMMITNILRKKLVGGPKKKLFLIVFFCYLIFANISTSDQIFDYETEVFVNKLLNNIKIVNNFKKDIK